MIRYYAIYEVPRCSFLRFPSTFVQTRLKNQNSQTLRPSDFRTYSSSSPPNLNVLKPERHMGMHRFTNHQMNINKLYSFHPLDLDIQQNLIKHHIRIKQSCINYQDHVIIKPSSIKLQGERKIFNQAMKLPGSFHHQMQATTRNYQAILHPLTTQLNHTEFVINTCSMQAVLVQASVLGLFTLIVSQVVAR